ncbi:MAG: hypothetical protein A4E19_04860 [Nitrospira sp. SG-bin1]|nr:MAG: hypothetical protein A4E19_04860 [Nitrospira sp. SG-bin1]
MSHTMGSRILLATDFSESSACARVYAEYFAARLTLPVDLLHVIEGPRERDDHESDPERTDEVSRLLEEQRKLLAGGIAVTMSQVRGRPSDQIVSTAQRLGADLVVMGMQGHTHTPFGLIGSTVERVIGAAACPVLSVPLPQKEASPCSLSESAAVLIRRILVPIDQSTSSLNALEYAMWLADRLKAGLVLMHVLQPCQNPQDTIHVANEETNRTVWLSRLTELATRARSYGLAAEQEIRDGITQDSILAGALQHHCDLIVMGTHAARHTSPPLGSVAKAVLRQATSPVLTVKDSR